MEEEIEINSEQAKFEVAIEKLTESKRATRIDGLKQIAETLKSNFHRVELEGFDFTLQEGVKKAFRGNEEEKILACQIITFYSLILGTDAHTIIAEYFPILKRIVDDNSNQIFISALKAQTILLFVGGDEKETEDFLNDLKPLMEQRKNENELSTAISCWSFLITTLSKSKITLDYLPIMIGFIHEYLKHKDLNVKIAAGEAIALLISIIQADYLDKEEEFDLYDIDGYIVVDDLLESVEEIKRLRDRSFNEKDSKLLKRSFRQIYDSITNFTSPYDELKVGKSVIKFESWSKVIQLNFLRDIVNSGFFSHLNENELFAQIFDFDLDMHQPRTIRKSEISFARKENDRLRTNERRKEMKNTFQHQMHKEFARYDDDHK